MLPMYTSAHIEDFNDLDCINDPAWYEKIFTIEELNHSHKKHLSEITRETIDDLVNQELIKAKDILEYYTSIFDKNDRVLSVGAGLCSKEIGLMKMGFNNIVCSEPTVLASHLKSLYPELEIECCKGTSLSFPDESFDGCFANSVIYCLDNEKIKSLVKEMARVTKPGGKIVLLCASNQNLLQTISYFSKGMKMYKEDGWKRSGWFRTYGEIKSLIKKVLPGVEIKGKYFEHERDLLHGIFRDNEKKLNLLGKLLFYISNRIVPITNTYNVWEFSKKEGKK